MRAAVVLAVVLAGVGLWVLPARADCDYNSPDQSPAPTPCNGPLRVVVVTPTPDPEATPTPTPAEATPQPVRLADAGDLGGMTEIGLGSLVLLTVVLLTRTFVKRRLPL
jgi:hypothetical protein